MTQLQQTISAMNSNGSLSSSLTSVGLGPLLGLTTFIFYHTNDQSNPTNNEDNANSSL